MAKYSSKTQFLEDFLEKNPDWELPYDSVQLNYDYLKDSFPLNAQGDTIDWDNMVDEPDGWLNFESLTKPIESETITGGLLDVAANVAGVIGLDPRYDAEGTIVGYMGNTVGADTEYSLIKANIQ